MAGYYEQGNKVLRSIKVKKKKLFDEICDPQLSRRALQKRKSRTEVSNKDPA
jgi:hypothetical protein